MRKNKILLSFILIFVLFSCRNSDKVSKNGTAIIKWHWEDDFKAKDKEKLKHWIEKTILATEKTLGHFPFDIHIYFHKHKDSNEPVPWAHTERGDTQKVHFYVDTKYDLQEFFDDWTAPHEISHLTLPFLGKKYSWFSEGYATFMQCQIMETMDVMSDEEVEEKYNSKLAAVKDKFMCSTAFVEVVDSLRKHHDFPAMYWGSVSFFIKADSILQNSGKQGLNEIIKKYQACCRMRDKNIDEMTVSLDSLSGSKIFSELLHEYENEPASSLFR